MKKTLVHFKKLKQNKMKKSSDRVEENNHCR